MALKATDDQCIAAYERFGHIGQAAGDLGIAKSTLHERLVRLGISTSTARAWGPQDDDILRAEYRTYRVSGRLRELAVKLNRTLGAVTTRAYTLGLTDPNAPEAPSRLPRERLPRSSDERYRAMQVALSLGALDHRMDVLVHEGDPMSKARSRFVKAGGGYTPAAVRAAEERMGAGFEAWEPFTGNVAVCCIFVRANAQRIDVDNMLKLVLDAATRAKLWADDSQVTAIAGLIEHDPYDPRTIVAMAPHRSTLARGEDSWPTCPTCGNRFNGDGRRKFCSRECRFGRPLFEEVA